jgi:ribose transport system substrate-binding protein
MKKWCVCVCMAVLVLGYAFGIGGSGQKDHYVIGVVLHDQQHGFQMQLGNGLKKQAKAHPEIELLFNDSELQVSRELSIVESYIDRKVDVIIMGALDSEASAAALKAANAAKIPVVCVDCPVNSGEAVSFVGYDSYKQGYIAGQLMKKYLNGRGKVAEVDFPFKSVVIDNRNRGFRDAIKGTAIEIVAVQSGDAKREKSATVSEYMITANPDLAGIFGVHGDAGLGALAAVESMKKDKIVVTTIDADKDVLMAIKRGSALRGIASTIPEQIGSWGLELALMAAKGEIVPAYVEIPVVVVEKPDVDKFFSNSLF